MLEPFHVIFGPKELARHRQRALVRSHASRDCQYDDRRHDTKHTSEEVDFIGLLGEEAACIALGARPANTLSQANGKRDVILVDGRRAEVKATFHEDGVLFLRPGNRVEAELLILAVFLPPGTIRLAGWVSKLRFDEEARQNHAGLPGCRVLEQHHLCPMDTL